MSNQGSTERPWSGLYRAGVVAALLTVVLVPIQAAAFIIWPTSVSAQFYFELLQQNKLYGLLALDVLYAVDNALVVLVLLALFVALRQTNRSATAVALALGLVGAGAFFSSNPAASMLTLGDQYAAATGEAQRAMYLAAGQAVLALFTSSAYHASYILGSIAGLTMSVVMLKSPAFGRTAGYAGIAANVLGFGLYVPVIGVWLSLLSVIPFLMIWYVLVARRLLRLARSEGA